mmetsp:Transcript_63530/g.75180  ORF Transcript_63530/g.75180 Transcript_63530/m.75180 type:complete len:159 (-) Transcript_63530:188-664(-)|eukprot:CAMPEP_0172497454 /NCGR_PEP_ID=MMETSP1066-20121228/100144_1 /TAXON_ID=671091 /ORGANISM="Coscinodiscus wailesii, Strain CCMP2513" /LENGTH=158 /DNA_ID=CAMNT_0013270247 /DNA_START=113 /DNA_END=589 /DNA_ORIENTATION=-
MGFTVHNGTVAASPSTVWNSCFEPMKWETWDPDVKCLESGSGTDSNLELADGRTFYFVMKSGKKLKATLEITKNQRLSYLGCFWGNNGKFEAEILLKATGEDKTDIQYTFGLNGCLGSVLAGITTKSINEGMQKSMENIIRISEDAQKTIREEASQSS